MAYYLVMSQTSAGCLHFEIITTDREQAQVFVNKKQTEAPEAQYMIQEFPEPGTPIPTPIVYPTESAVQQPPAPVPIPSQEAPPAPPPPPSPTF